MDEDAYAAESVSSEGISDRAANNGLNPYAVEFVPVMGQDGAGLTGASVPLGVHTLPQSGCNIYEQGKMRSCETELGQTLQLQGR